MPLKLTIILFINLSICIGKSSADPVPTISYECSINKTVSIKNTTINLNRLHVLKNGADPCKPATTTLNDCGVQSGETVTVLLQDETESKVLGGLNSHKFTLKCEDEGNYTVTNAPNQLNGRILTTGITLSQPVAHTLTLTLNEKGTSNPITTVSTGQEFTMTMAITDSNYIISPIECIAKGDTTESYKIWTQGPSCQHDSSIIEGKWSGQTQATLSISMYGFFFTTSTHVKIVCTTQVCKTSNQGACSQECLTLPKKDNAIGRRRREASNPKNETFSYVKSVEVAFDVADNEAGVNSAIDIMPKKPVFLLIGITVYTIMQLI